MKPFARPEWVRNMAETRFRVVMGAVVFALAVGALLSTVSAQFTPEELERNPRLSPAMRKLISAYENYLHHFPNGPNAKAYLIDEAGRFRDAGDHQTAIVVLERVLRRGDITQADRAYSYKQIMDCYRTLGQHDIEEEWAYRMAVADVGREEQQRAKDFIFDAGLSRAKALEDSADFERAGEAYERLSVKNPDHRNAPAAMLKAADLYIEAGDKARAAQTYERFYYTYPDYKDPTSGKGALVTLETAASLYAEMNDYRHAADAAERILAAAPNHPDRQRYMSSLAATYALLRDYNNAIRVRQQYIALYPRDPNSGSYQWEIAQYRGLAGQRRQQLAEYESFIRSYPSDVRAIEANLLIGQDRLREREKATTRGASDEAERLLAEARRYFERSYGLHDSLEEVKANSGDLLHAIPAIQEVAKMDSTNYYSIRLKGSQNFSRDSTLKQQALIETANLYLKIAQYPYVPTKFEALYKRGRLFEDFAYEYLRQPRPDTAITYEEIHKVFFINLTSQTVLRGLAIPAYATQMLDFYQEHQAEIDTAAFSIPDPGLHQQHLYWLEQARERLGLIPQKLDSLELNTVRYRADLIVLEAQEQIPKMFQRGWVQFQQQQRQRYRDNPRLIYSDRMDLFDRAVTPLVYGKGIDDTSATINFFQKTIAEGKRLGADDAWVLYNRGRLRLVYAARSSFFHTVADESVLGLGTQIDTMRNKAADLTAIIGRLPQLDLSSIGPLPERPSLTPPPPPERPPGEFATWTTEQKVKLARDFQAYKQAIENMNWRARRYRRDVERWQQRRQELVDRYRDANREIVQEVGREIQGVGQVAYDTQLYRVFIEQQMTRATDALERDIAFGDSAGYSEADKRAVRDSAVTSGLRLATQMDSLYQVVWNYRQHFESKRADTSLGGEGSLPFQIYSSLVNAYAAAADSFRSAAIRRYLYLYEGSDSLFALGLENPTVTFVIKRLRDLDPTFGVRTVSMKFAFVTEDSSGLWRVSTLSEYDKSDAWKGIGFNDSSWVPAVKGTMPRIDWGGESASARAESRTETPPDTVAATGTEAATPSDTLAGANAETPSDTLAAAPADTGQPSAEPQPSEAPQEELARIKGFPTDNLNMTDIWSPTRADTVYLRYKLELPPRWSELPDSLREPGRPRPVVRNASVTITADDDYAVYLNGEVTNAIDQPTGRVDWQNARTTPILKEAWLVGDTANVAAIRASNETRVDRFPDTNPSTYGVMARFDVEMDVPYDVWAILYKPPEPEPEFVLAFTHEDSIKLADTTGTYFATPQERERWMACRERALRAVWTDSVLIPWRMERAELRFADLDTQIVRLSNWIAEQQQAARLRLAQAASEQLGVEPAPEAPSLEEQGVPEENAPQEVPEDSNSEQGTPQPPEESNPSPIRRR